MAQKTIPELQEITSPPIATTFLAADDGTQTFKLSLGELLRRPKNYRPAMVITPSVAAALSTFEHIIKLEVLMDEDGLEWWVADINVQFSQAAATQTGFTIAFTGLLFESFAEQPGVLAVTPSGGSPVIYTAGTSLYCTPNTNVLVAKHPSTNTIRYGVQGRFMLKEKPSFAADTEFLVLDGAGNPTGGGGLVNVAGVNTSGTITANTLEECDSSAGSITRTLPPLPLGGVGQKGITVVLLDAARAASDTLDIVLAPATGERLNIPGLVANDTLAINCPGGWIGAYAAPGDTSWKIQTQSTTTVAEASTSNAGVITTGAQSIAGDKTFTGKVRAADIQSGTYSPSFVISSALTSVTASGVAKWTRNGNIVEVMFYAAVTTNGSLGGVGRFFVSLPVPTNTAAYISTDIIGHGIWQYPAPSNGGYGSSAAFWAGAGTYAQFAEFFMVNTVINVGAGFIGKFVYEIKP